MLPYLAHRISIAGGSYEEIFLPGTESIFHSFSQGCPRLISLLADRVLLSAYAKQLRPVPLALVEEKAKAMVESHGVAPDLQSDGGGM